MKQKLVTIDGASGTGKSSLAINLSKKLNSDLLLSGLIYRLVAHYSSGEDYIGFIKRLKADHVKIIPEASGAECYYRGVPCYELLMHPSIAEQASIIAAKAELRLALLPLQREFYGVNGLVAEGRDMGSVVFPEADLKVYLTANINVRAARRAKELQLLGKSISISELLGKMEKRDARDANRSSCPLVCPDEAAIIDTSNLTLDQVVQLVINKLGVV